jgi:hypothetical protein
MVTEGGRKPKRLAELELRSILLQSREDDLEAMTNAPHKPSVDSDKATQSD